MRAMVRHMHRLGSMASRSLSALCLLVAAAACTGSEAPVSSRVDDHTLGQPTVASYAWLWADESEAELKTVEAASARLERPKYLPLDHDATRALQRMIDAMHDSLRGRHREALKKTPSPRVVIKQDNKPNAYVRKVPIAWNLPTRVARPDGASDERPNPRTDFALTGRGQVTGPPSAVLERPHDDEALQQLVAFHNERFELCRLSVEAGGVVLDTECANANYHGARSERFVYFASSKWIVVTTGLLLTLLDEDRVAAVLAHELGHFYRAHATLPIDVLNYFYALDDGNHVHHPPPDPRHLELTASVRTKLRADESLEGRMMAGIDEHNRTMRDEKLGFYTTEQEADDLGLELLLHLRIPPTVAADALLALHRANPGGHDTTWEACSMLRSKGFKDDSGRWAYVPIGNLATPHHSFCFRVLNITREIEAHDYRLSGTPRPHDREWGRIVAKLAAP
jgi:Zn-dependent protease with chaperone function